MSDGYISKERLKRLSKACDGWFDFNKIFGDKKIFFGLVKVGKTAEKVDDKFFLFLFTLLNKMVSKDQNIQAAAVLDKMLDFLEARDIDGFNGYVAGLLAAQYDLPLVKDDKALFLSVLNAFKEALNYVIDEFDQAVAIAEAEAAAENE